MKTALLATLVLTMALVVPNAYADPVRLLPDGDIEFDLRIATSGSFACRNTEYAPDYDCRALGDGSIMITAGGESTRLSFAGHDQTVAVAASDIRSITLGEIVGDATPGFVFPTLPSPEWSLLTLFLRISHGSDQVSPVVLGGGGWDFAPGGGTTLPLLRGEHEFGVPTGIPLDGYSYDFVVYRMRNLSVGAAGVTPVIADINAIPEPGTVLLLGSGLAALVRTRRRKHSLGEPGSGGWA